MNCCNEEVPEIGRWISSTGVREVAKMTGTSLSQFDEIYSKLRCVDGPARPGLPSVYWSGASKAAVPTVVFANAYGRTAFSFLQSLFGPAGATR